MIHVFSLILQASDAGSDLFNTANHKSKYSIYLHLTAPSISLPLDDRKEGIHSDRDSFTCFYAPFVIRKRIPFILQKI